MDIKEINEAIYASSNGAIVERRKSIVVPLLVFLVGVAMLVVNYFVENGNDANNLKSALVLSGGCISLVGAVLCGMCVFGGGVPYHKDDKCFLVRKQYSFDRLQQRDVVKVVNDIDKNTLDKLSESDVTGVLVICYYSPEGNYLAMQAFAYEEFVYKPITELKIKV